MPYLHAGQGDPVLFIHGFADQKETWSLVARLLSRGYRVIAPDLPGYGAADRIEDTHADTDSQARFVRQFLDELGIGRAHVVGNSMGGGIAQRLATLAPAQVQTLTLICSMGPAIRKSQFTEHLEIHGGNALIPRSVEQYISMLDWVFEHKPPFPGPLLRHMARRQVARADDYEAYFSVLETEWDWSQVETPQQPTLVIQGRRDRVIHPATARGLVEQLPDARLLMLAGTGHAPQWEKPRATARALQGFLGQFPIG